MFNSLISRKSSDRVFIVGGGSSVSSIDLSKLKNEDVITCNNAYQIVPWALFACFSDKPWLHIHWKEFSKFSGLKVCATAYDLSEFRDKIKIDVLLKRGGPNGLSKTTDKLNGANTGHMAINLAFLLGYKEIYLIGFDMDVTAKKLHWHPEHQCGSNVGMYTTFLESFETIPDALEYTQTKIFNLNSQSKIKCFEFKDYDSLFH